MRTKDYSVGAFTLLREGVSSDAVLDGLKKVLRANHHTNLYPKILNALQTALIRDARKRKTLVTLAHEDDKTKLKEAIVEKSRELHAEEPFTYKIDASVIGGYRIESNGKSLDHTHKAQLQTLYKSLTESL